MTKEKMLEYIKDKHKAALKRAGVELNDAPENLFYVLADAAIYEDAAQQKQVLDREIEKLITDKKAAMAATSSPSSAALELVEWEVTNVSI